LMGLQQGLLDHVRRVELAPQPGVQVQSGQQPQVSPKPLQRPVGALGLLVHRWSSTGTDAKGGEPWARGYAFFRLRHNPGPVERQEARKGAEKTVGLLRAGVPMVRDFTSPAEELGEVFCRQSASRAARHRAASLLARPAPTRWVLSLTGNG